MKKQENEKEIILENYDGSQAYFELVKYSVGKYLDLNGELFATPRFEEMTGLDLIVDNETLNKRYPILKIVDENYGYQQALARIATPKEKILVYNELKQIAKDMGIKE